MKFRVNRDDFADSVAWVARSLPSRPAVPVLGGILLTTADEGLQVAGFDYEVSSKVTVPAEIGDDGTALVSGRLLADVTKALPQKPVDVELDGTNVSITCGSAKFTLPVMPVEDYPQLPEVPTGTGVIAADTFAEAIAQVAVAASRDDTLPMLTGIRVEIKGSTLTLAATDRFRLAVREIAWDPTVDDIDTAVLVPAKTFSDSAKTAASDGQPVTIALGDEARGGRDGLLGVLSAQRHTTTRLLDADYPNFRQLLPQSHSAIARVSVQELSDAIKRVSLVAHRRAQVQLAFADDVLTLTAGGGDEGRAEEQLQVEFVGEPLTIAFNPGYLLEGLGVIHTPTVDFGFTQPERPAVLRPAGDDLPVADGTNVFPVADASYTYLLMPVRLPG